MAVFKLVKKTAASAQDAVANTISALPIDSHTTDVASNQLAAPQVEGQYVRSFEIWSYLQCTAAPETECYAFKVWGPATQPDFEATPADKIIIYWGTSEEFANPTDSESSVATTIQHSNYYSSGAALSLPCQEADDKVNAVGEKVGFLVEQWKIACGAYQGTLPAQIRHVSWSES